MLKPSTTAALLVALVSALVPASGSAYIPRPPIASADEAEGPKTRVRGINSAAGTCVGAEEPASLELHCGICEAWLGTASGFSIYANANPLRYTDPEGTESCPASANTFTKCLKWSAERWEREQQDEASRRAAIAKQSGDQAALAQAIADIQAAGAGGQWTLKRVESQEGARFIHRKIGFPMAVAGVGLTTGIGASGLAVGGGGFVIGGGATMLNDLANQEQGKRPPQQNLWADSSAGSGRSPRA